MTDANFQHTKVISHFLSLHGCLFFCFSMSRMSAISLRFPFPSDTLSPPVSAVKALSCSSVRLEFSVGFWFTLFSSWPSHLSPLNIMFSDACSFSSTKGKYVCYQLHSFEYRLHCMCVYIYIFHSTITEVTMYHWDPIHTNHNKSLRNLYFMWCCNQLVINTWGICVREVQ